MGDLLIGRFKNKGKPNIILTKRMIRDLCYQFDRGMLSINAQSLWLHISVQRKVDLDIHTIQNFLDSLENDGTLVKLWDKKDFIGYQYKGENIE